MVRCCISRFIFGVHKDDHMGIAPIEFCHGSMQGDRFGHIVSGHAVVGLYGAGKPTAGSRRKPE